LLREVGIEAAICADLAALEQALGDETCFLLVAEEALLDADLRGLVGRLERQPPWADLPIVILSHRGGTTAPSSEAVRLAELFGNVTFLERPFHPATFASVARTALKGRLRQYEVRARVEELHESEERLRTALIAGRLGSWELGLATRRFTASDTCRTHFGRGGEEPFTYDDLVASIHPGDREWMGKAVQAAAEGGENFAAECRTLWPDGALHWVEIRARLVRNRRGGNPRLVGVCSDITERKTAEERLKRLNESLEERVAERTAELNAAHADRLAEIEQRQYAEMQLRHAQKMEAIGQLTGGVAHDFNNLLMAVLSNLQLLRKRVPDDPKTTRLIESALLGAQRGASLTQRLLAFAHRQDLKIESRNLADLIRGMTDLIENSIGAGVELQLKLPQSLPPALVDGNQLELAVLNLVVNARDAMPRGGLLTIEVDQVFLGAADSLPNGSYLRIAVSDTGHGMDAQTLQRAAEPFFSTKELGKGTGLGLSMIHGLAVQLHGELRLISEVGRGTRAELWLPATAVAAAPDRPAGAMATAAGASGATILVVDDDSLISMSTVDMLEDLGHRVVAANSGEEALKVLRSDAAIDLLVTDYAMPRMNGAQLAEAARRLRPRLPVLLATGYAELPPGSTLELPRIGKPYMQEQLASIVDRLLRGADSGAVRLSVGEPVGRSAERKTV